MLYGKVNCNKGEKNAYLPPPQHLQTSRNGKQTDTTNRSLWEKSSLLSLPEFWSGSWLSRISDALLGILLGPLPQQSHPRQSTDQYCILYKNLVQLIKARTGGSINTTGLTSILYYLITHLRNICFNTVPHCKIPSHALKKNFPCPQTQFLFLFLCAEMARKSKTLDQLKLEA